MTPDTSRSERFCANCGGSMTGRSGSVYCGQPCRRNAFSERSREGRVASVRKLKGGRLSVVVHLGSMYLLKPILWQNQPESGISGESYGVHPART